MPNAAKGRIPGDQEESSIYLAGDNDLREAGRAIGISLLGVDAAGPATFSPDSGDFRKDWNAWLSDCFADRLSKPFIGIFLAAGEMRNRQIRQLDQEIDSHLSGEERERSLAAAAPFLEGTSEMRRLPQWMRFRDAIERAELPGHVTSLFALRAALFHLPLLPALVSYAYFEWKSGASSTGDVPDKALNPAHFQSGYPESAEVVLRVFRRERGESKSHLASI